MACVGCLAALLLCMLALLLFMAVTTKDGSLTNLYNAWLNVEKCRRNLTELGPALTRYHNRNGEYPEKLEQLYPDYLNSQDILWCPTDKERSGPAGYTYKRPKADAPGSTIALQCHRHKPTRDQSITLNLRLDSNVEVTTKAVSEIPKDKGKPAR